MKTRQIELLRLLMLNQNPLMDEIMHLYDISQRTLYYDIQNLNEHIRKYGEISTKNNRIFFQGDLPLLISEADEKVFDPHYKSKERQDILLYKILNEEEFTLEQIANQFKVSKNTVFQDVDTLRNRLKNKNIELAYNEKYSLEGDEWLIRDYYLKLLSKDRFNHNIVSEEVKNFDVRNNLMLSDLSLFYLSKFLNFVNLRVSKKNIINDFQLEYMDKGLIQGLEDFINTKNTNEINYLTAYILSLSSNKIGQVNKEISKYVNELINNVQVKLLIHIPWEQSFIDSLENHLRASYFRIKYQFPVLNPSNQQLKSEYFDLFYLIKHVIRDTEDELGFNEMREAEIGFVVAYFGGYLLKNENLDKKKKQIVIVCPQGQIISNHLKYQIEHYLPDVEIVGTRSIDQLGKLTTSYDYIVTTVDLGLYNNTIKVNPILSDIDKYNIIEKLSPEFKNKENLVNSVIDLVDELSNQPQEVKFREVFKLLFLEEKNWRCEPLLADLLKKEKIIRQKSVKTWEEGIRLASQPLLSNKDIEKKYIDAMIEAVNEYGPYNVLTDYFALPHASNASGVNKLSMSMLILDEAVDMLGKPVKIFLVLATVDNKSHLKALSSLTEILLEPENMEIFLAGDKDKIMKLIKKSEEV